MINKAMLTMVLIGISLSPIRAIANPDAAKLPVQSSSLASPTHPSDTSAGQPPRVSSQETSNTDLMVLDKALNVLNFSAAALGITVGVFAIILTIAAAMGFMEIRRWRSISKEMEESSVYLQRMMTTVKATRLRLSQQLRLARAELDITPTQEQRDLADELSHALRILPLIGEELNSDDYIYLGIDSYYKNRRARAMDYFDEALKRDASKDDAWNYKSLLSYHMGKFDDMLKAAEVALQINPQNPSAWNNKAEAQLKLNRLDEALDSVRRAKEIRSGFDEAWITESVIRLKRGETDQAIQCLTEAIRLDSANRSWAQKDPDYAPLQSNPDFVRLTATEGG